MKNISGENICERYFILIFSRTKFACNATSWQTVLLCNVERFHVQNMTGPNGAVAKSSINGLVGTGFTHQYQLQPRAGF